jgi:hypothetical protein
MPSDTEDDPWFRPVWADEEPELPPLPRRVPARPIAPDWLAGADPIRLLGPLCAAQDMLSRLDAKAEAASEPVRAGLVARLAFREAAGWLATVGAWVHPRDLALRAGHLIGLGELPNTAGHQWQDMNPEARVLAESHLQTALALARLLQQLTRQPRLFADPDAALAALSPLAGACDPQPFTAWLTHRATEPLSKLPLLLRMGLVASRWMEAGLTDLPSPAAALAISAGLLASGGALRAIPLPFWAAAPALAAGELHTLPRLRSDVAARLFPEGPPGWLAVFLSLTTEAARAGMQELDRLQTAAQVGAALLAGLDRRARLPEIIDRVLREPVVTTKGLSRALRITPQTALRLLNRLAGDGVVRETTGRRSFRAFAI